MHNSLHEKRRETKLLLYAAVLALLINSAAIGKPVDVGTHGVVWEIAEKDPVSEIQAAFKNRSAEIEEKIVQLQDLKRFSPKIPMATLSIAKENDSYLVDFNYTLEEDVIGKEGELIYPAGTRYNLLDYPPFPTRKKYVFFDGANPTEVDFVISRFSEDPQVVFVTSGSTAAWFNAKEKIGSGLKMLTQELAETLHLDRSVSVAFQEGKFFRIDVFAVPPESS